MVQEPEFRSPPDGLSADRSNFIARMWDRATRHPFVTLWILVAVQTVPALWSRDLTFFDEVRHGDALRGLLRDGHSIVLHMNGQPYPDKPPVWFWIVAGFAKLLGTEGPPAFFAASAASGFALLLATWAMARRVLRGDAGGDAGGALAAAMMLFASPLFLIFDLSTRMDLLFAALIVLSEICLFRGLSRRETNSSTVLGFGLAGVATLVKGPLGIALPLLTAVAWLAWRGSMRRLLRWDVLSGFVAMLLLVGGWMAAAYMVEGKEYVKAVFGGQVLDRALDAGKNAGGIWFYVAIIPALWLPWTLVWVGAPPRGLFSKVWWQERWRGRRESDSGRVFLWATVVSGFVLLTAVSTKLSRYQLPLYGPIAILTVDAWRRLDPGAARRAWIALGALLLAAAAVVPFVDRVLHSYFDWPIHIAGLPLASAILAATGVAVIVLRGFPMNRPLRATVLGMTALSLVMSLVVAPSLEPVLCPKEQALVIADYARQGYEVHIVRTFPGTYSYHADMAFTESDTWTRPLIGPFRRPTLLSMPTKYARKHPEVVLGFVQVHEQWLADETYGVWIYDGRAPRAQGTPDAER